MVDDQDRLDDGRLRIARIVGVHGLKGAVRLKLFLDDPASLYDFGDITDRDGVAYDISLGHQQKGHWVAMIEGVTDRDAAAALNQTDLYISSDARPDLDEDEFYAADLIGMTAVTSAGTVLGTIASLDDYGAGPLIEIDLKAGGAPLVVPFTQAVVPVIDTAQRRVTVDPPPGYLDDPGAPDTGPEGEGSHE